MGFNIRGLILIAGLGCDASKQGYRLSFRDADGRKKSIRLGNDLLGASHAAKASEWKLHIEHILLSQKRKQPPCNATYDWTLLLTDEQHVRLSNAGLDQARNVRDSRSMTLAEWLDTYISERLDVKSSTRETYDKAKDCLVAHFGPTKLIRDIRPDDAKRWRVWLGTSGNHRDKIRKSMSDATVRRRTGKARQFFAESMERGLIDENPFAKLPSNVGGNDKRLFFVPADSIEACMKYSPSEQWRTILALARYGGLRCPSELMTLRWEHVDLPAGRFTVHSTKTEHHTGGGVRVVPIFPELRPYLEAAWDGVP